MKLSDRVEALAGPDQEVFREVAAKLWQPHYSLPVDWDKERFAKHDRLDILIANEAWLCAAEMFMSNHDFWRVGHDGEGQDPSAFKAQVGVEREGECWHTFATAIAPDASLALTAAALRARGL
ncbi:MAG: hypothetical protein ACRCVX_12600 [Shewanella sp.]